MDKSMPIGLEIERRFLILRPDVEALVLRYGAKVREIVQTYLVTPEGYSSERVRCTDDGIERVYTHIRKRRVAHGSALEEELRIDEDEYRALLLCADPALHAIEKRRVSIPFGGRCYEIDLYPFFRSVAVLEVELDSIDAPLTMLPELAVLREITGVKALSNHALAARVPSEESLLRSWNNQ